MVIRRKRSAPYVPMQRSWAPISRAPHSRVILVNDTNAADAPFVAAKWLSEPSWSGWIYQDPVLNDFRPLGPAPTAWIDVPHVPLTSAMVGMSPEPDWLPIITAPTHTPALVNDTQSGGCPRFVVARWRQDPRRPHWAYECPLLAEFMPLGPCPTFWLDIPLLPEALQPRELSAVAQANALLRA